jgi:hypothetical protein
VLIQIRELIFQMVADNPTWGTPRIHGELLMLGFDVSETTISRWMKRAPKDPQPAKRWLAFLRNKIKKSKLPVSFYDSSGKRVAVGQLITDDNGDTAFLIPEVARAKGSYMEIRGRGFFVNPMTVKWSGGLWWSFGFSKGIDPEGLPGITPHQTWTFLNPERNIGVLDVSFFSSSYSYSSSNFDVTYTLIGSGLYAMTIEETSSYGGHSYIRLLDRTPHPRPEAGYNGYLAFPAGSNFGTIQYVTEASGTFNFSAIGVSGTWTYDPQTNFTTGTITSASPFTSDAVVGWQSGSRGQPQPSE